MSNITASEIQYMCPHTNRPLGTGVRSDARTLTKAWDKEMHLQCPHCGMAHDFRIRDIFLEQALLPRVTATAAPRR